MTHEKLREVRKKMGVTQVHIAKSLGKSPAWYHGIETGRTKLDVETLKKIAEILGVDVSIFFAK